ncbi:DUF502 domain-containing protein [Neisseria sp. Ec49-e6-T10]|uniref:DUF502 domain-containing protein n=1 Tax=Neisseria sp. Ec49-e6-T10 TaxID=3140744 RepID=UPI003EBEFE8E
MSDQEAVKEKKSKNKLTLKGYLVTGILVWMPVAVTFWVISLVVGTLDDTIKLLPSHLQPKELFGMDLPGFGLVLSILLLLGTGVFAANVLGQKILDGWDQLLSRIPVVKSIYTSVKKVSDTLLSDSSQSFKTPIWVRFPHQNAWSLAFVTGNVPSVLQQELAGTQEEQFISVYVPTTPNPTSGYFVLVKLTDTKPCQLTVDQALKYVISLGMVVPDHMLPEQEKTIKQDNKIQAVVTEIKDIEDNSDK